MTIEEAVEILKGAIKKPNTKDGYLGQALDMAIEALKEHSDYKTAWDNLKERVKRELDSCTGNSILSLERAETLSHILDLMGASEEEILGEYIKRSVN